jgi:hypothetical protein
MDNPTPSHYNPALTARKKTEPRAVKRKRRTPLLKREVRIATRGEMAKNFYQYTGPGGQTLHGYERQYKGVQLRKKGFTLKREAEKDLRKAMDDMDAAERGEIRCAPTTAQEALDIYRRSLEIRGQSKARQYTHNINSNCKVLQEFLDHFGPKRLIRQVTEDDLREFYQILCFKPTINKNSAGAFRTNSRHAQSGPTQKARSSHMAAPNSQSESNAGVRTSICRRLGIRHSRTNIA